MFKKLKEKLADEVKANPRLQGTLDSVNQLAATTYSSLTKEGGSRDSLSNLSLSSQVSTPQNNGLSGSQSDLASLPSLPPTAPSASSGSGQFFSLGEDDEPVSLSAAGSPAKTPTPNNSGAMTSTPVPRGRRLSSSSQQDASLFPIWEDPDHENLPLFSDLESCAGSEAGWDDSGSAQLAAVSKEQLYSMLSKARARYHKYKGRYADLSRAYTDLQTENKKVKEVMQQTQDRALRRIGELREQAGLEQQAKAHLEEELRAEMEEKDHMIVTLNTKACMVGCTWHRTTRCPWLPTPGTWGRGRWPG